MAATLSERRGLTFEHARQWMMHVGLVTPLDQVDGDAELVAAARSALEEGVHQIADTVRNSLNFYRMQESAESVDRAILTGPAADVPGLPERLAELLRMPVDAVTVAHKDGVEHAGRLTVAAGPRGRRAPVAPVRQGRGPAAMRESGPVRPHAADPRPAR